MFCHNLQPIRKALKTPEFVLSKAIYFRTKKSFVDAHFLQDCSLRVQKQDGHDQLNGKVESSSQETIVSDEAALDQRHYEKSCFHTCW